MATAASIRAAIAAALAQGDARALLVTAHAAFAQGQEHIAVTLYKGQPNETRHEVDLVDGDGNQRTGADVLALLRDMLQRTP